MGKHMMKGKSSMKWKSMTKSNSYRKGKSSMKWKSMMKSKSARRGKSSMKWHSMNVFKKPRLYYPYYGRHPKPNMLPLSLYGMGMYAYRHPRNTMGKGGWMRGM